MFHSGSPRYHSECWLGALIGRLLPHAPAGLNVDASRLMVLCFLPNACRFSF
jgi:hypothetical protein